MWSEVKTVGGVEKVEEISEESKAIKNLIIFIFPFETFFLLLLLFLLSLKVFSRWKLSLHIFLCVCSDSSKM